MSIILFNGLSSYVCFVSESSNVDVSIIHRKDLASNKYFWWSVCKTRWFVALLIFDGKNILI